MKKLFALILSLCLAVFGFSCTPSGENSGSAGDSTGTDSSSSIDDGGINLDDITYETYGSFWLRQHNAEVMPVGAYNSCPPQWGSSYTYNYLTNESTFADYKAAGVNMMMGLYESANSEDVLNALDWCEQYGLSYLLSGVGVQTNVSMAKSLLAKVKYKEAFGGIMHTDEPGRISFEGLKASADIINSALGGNIEGALIHDNLFPTYANQYQLYFRVYDDSSVLPEGGYGYEQYVSDYMEIVKPQVLSYDHYPICGGGDYISGGAYFTNMSIIRRYAMQYNVPFWVFIQTCKFSGIHRIPTLAETLWQVNTALSYGAKGIQYFTGVLPADGGGEVFQGAMFDRDGKKTEVYDYVKTANMQIQAVDEVLMRAISKGIIVNGDMPWVEADAGTVPEEDRLDSYGKLVSVNALHAITGCFDHDGKNAFYITNNTNVEGDTVTLNFSGNESGYFVQKAAKTQFNGQNSLTLTLDAGEGVLVVLSK